MLRRFLVAGLLATVLTAGYVWLVDPPPVDATTPGAVCELHGKPLVEDLVPIVYGLPPRWSEPDRESYRATCPWAQPRWSGGCVVGAAKTARVSYCLECRKALAAWQAAHPNAR